MGARELVTGDVFHEVGTAYAGTPSLPFNLASAQGISVCIVDAEHSQQLSEPVQLSADAEGADWANGIIVIEIPEAITLPLASYAKRETMAKLEIQAIVDDKPFTWFGDVLLRQGFLS